MGSARPRPRFLATKLLRIRQHSGLSQQQLLIQLRLSAQDQIHYTTISKYEHDKNEPPLAILLAYARFATVPVELLIDDEIQVDTLFTRILYLPIATLLR
jgi:transcriptional regulator with XRE-family HTH domain